MASDGLPAVDAVIRQILDPLCRRHRNEAATLQRIVTVVFSGIPRSVAHLGTVAPCTGRGFLDDLAGASRTVPYRGGGGPARISRLPA